MADRCPSSVCYGDYVCCLDTGHEGEHVARKFGSRHGSVWTSWDDHDADAEEYACSHTETELIEGKMGDDGTLWRCTVCGDVLKEIHDPENGTTWVDSIPSTGGRKVRYLNLTQTLVPRADSVRAATDAVPKHRSRPLGAESTPTQRADGAATVATESCATDGPRGES